MDKFRSPVAGATQSNWPNAHLTGWNQTSIRYSSRVHSLCGNSIFSLLMWWISHSSYTIFFSLLWRNNRLLPSNLNYELVKPVELFSNENYCFDSHIEIVLAFPMPRIVIYSNVAFKMHFTISRYQYFHASSLLHFSVFAPNTMPLYRLHNMDRINYRLKWLRKCHHEHRTSGYFSLSFTVKSICGGGRKEIPLP